MTHRRDPGSLAEAITRVVADLGGDQACAKVTGIAKALLQAWKNPERDAVPNLEQAITLDRAWMAAKPESFPPPIAGALLLRLYDTGSGRPDLHLVTDMTRVSEDVGRVLAFALEQLRIRGTGASVVPTANERETLLAAVTSAMNRLARVRHALDGREDLKEPIVMFQVRRAEPVAPVPRAKRNLLQRMLG